MAKTILEGATRGSYFKLDPFAIIIVGLDTNDGPEHPLYDKRITLPLDEDMIEGICLYGVLISIRVVVIDGKPHVTDGRQRVRNARAAIERLRARGEVSDILIPATAEKMGDEDRQALIGIVTNEHRFGDSPLIRAAKMQQLLDRGIDVKRIALVFRVSVATVQANLKIGTLSAPVKRAIESGAISPTAAAKLADLPKADQVAALDLAVAESPGKKPTAAKVARVVNPDAVKVSKVDAAYERGVRDAIEKIRWSMANSANPTWLEGTRCALEMVQALIGEGPVPGALAREDAHADATAASRAINGTPVAEAAE
jgi:hypothetical protein